MIDRLENGNRGRAMAKLRVPPLGGDSSQWVSLFTGWSMGVIFVCCIIAAVACKLIDLMYMYIMYDVIR